MEQVYKLKAYLDGGHNLSSVELGVRATSKDEAVAQFRGWMEHMGYRRQDYGPVFQWGKAEG